MSAYYFMRVLVRTSVCLCLYTCVFYVCACEFMCIRVCVCFCVHACVRVCFLCIYICVCSLILIHIISFSLLIPVTSEQSPVAYQLPPSRSHLCVCVPMYACMLVCVCLCDPACACVRERERSM